MVDSSVSPESCHFDAMMGSTMAIVTANRRHRAISMHKAQCAIHHWRPTIAIALQRFLLAKCKSPVLWRVSQKNRGNVAAFLWARSRNRSVSAFPKLQRFRGAKIEMVRLLTVKKGFFSQTSCSEASNSTASIVCMTDAFQKGHRMTSLLGRSFKEETSWRKTKAHSTGHPHTRQEHSMDQCRSRLKLPENLEPHWSIPFSWGNSYGSNIGPYLFLRNSYGPMVLKVLQKFPPAPAPVHGWLFPAYLRHLSRNSGECGGTFAGTLVNARGDSEHALRHASASRIPLYTNV